MYRISNPMKLTLAALVVAAAGSVALVAQAQPMDGMGHGPGGPRGPMAHLRQLGLTAPQREKIEAIQDAERRGAIEIRKDLELAQLDMHRLMKADSPDRRAIDVQIDRVAELRTRLHKARVNAMLDVRGVLTPQQREKLEQLRELGDDQAPGPKAPGMRGPDRQGGTRSR